MYSFGDNSTGQLSSIELRQYEPLPIETEFKALAVFSGLNHNVVKTTDGRLFRWGGVSKLKAKSSKFSGSMNFMDEFKGKRTSNII